MGTAIELDETSLYNCSKHSKKKYTTHSKYGKHRRTNLKTIETNPNCSFWKHVSLTVFQSLFTLLLLFDFCYVWEIVILSLVSNFSSWIANKDAQLSLWRKWTEKPCHSSFNKTKFFTVHAILAGFLKTFTLWKKNLSRQPGFRSFQISQYNN